MPSGLRSAFPDLKVTIDQTIAQGDKVVLRWTAHDAHWRISGISRRRGRKLLSPGTFDSAIVNGKIVEGWDNWDQLGLLVQIGAVPVHFPKPVQAA